MPIVISYREAANSPVNLPLVVSCPASGLFVRALPIHTHILIYPSAYLLAECYRNYTTSVRCRQAKVCRPFVASPSKRQERAMLLPWS
jgi:hypothetical protein